MSQAQDPILFKMISSISFSLVTSVMQGGWRFSKSANFAQTGILGRSSPILTYGNSNAIELSVTLDLVTWDSVAKDIKSLTRGLLAHTFPVEPGLKPPPLITLDIGNIIEDWACVMSSCDISAGDRDLWDADGTPRTATAALSFIGYEEDNVQASDWYDGTQFQYLSF